MNGVDGGIELLSGRPPLLLLSALLGQLALGRGDEGSFAVPRSVDLSCRCSRLAEAVWNSVAW